MYKDNPTKVYPFKRSSNKLLLIPLTPEKAKEIQPIGFEELTGSDQAMLSLIQQAKDPSNE